MTSKPDEAPKRSKRLEGAARPEDDIMTMLTGTRGNQRSERLEGTGDDAGPMLRGIGEALGPREGPEGGCKTKCRTDRTAVLAIDPADVDESPAELRQQPVIQRRTTNKDIPLKGTVTSERPSSSFGSEDEGSRLGIENNEGIRGVAPVSDSGAETGG